MPTVALPAELTKGFWDKKKGALDGAGLDDTLKALQSLQKKHEAVDWAKLAEGWPKAAGKDAGKLKALHEALDKLYRAKALPLKAEAAALAVAAEKAAKAKDAAKPRKDACTLIAKEAQAYAKAVAAGLDALEREAAAALKALPQEDEAGEDEGEEPANALLDPVRLLKQLRLCKADPARQVFFAYLDNNKQDPLLAVHHRINGRALMARLVKDTGIKTGAFGALSIDGTLLKLVVEKRHSGLVKRIRIPIRACGFKLGKVLLVDEAGQTLDQDDEQDQDEGQQAAARAMPPPGLKPSALPLLQLWAKVRGEAVDTLKGVAREIAELKDPESAKAVIEISAVVKNLTVEPHTPQQIAELVHYIHQDDVVQDVSEFASDIRTPLLKVLNQLHKAVSA